MTLTGKTAVISGASRGLGRQLALALAGRGVHLHLIARGREQLAAVAARASALGVSCNALVCDLADAQAVTAVAERVRAHGEVDILINNAGLGFYKPFVEHSGAEHDAIIDVNLRAPVLLTRLLLPDMLARGSGHIVNIGSDLAARTIPNMVVYTATKFALRGFTLSLAQEVRSRGIQVSLVNPGIIDSGFNNAVEGSRHAADALQPDQLAALVVMVLEQPEQQMIDEITVHPQMQAY
jgi:short-subunit dehydrogenase